jgi:hypothetical protein
MLDQIFGGNMMPQAPSMWDLPQMKIPKYLFKLFMFGILVVIVLFSWIPMGKYPGYAQDPHFSPAYWTGAAQIFYLPIFYKVMRL